MGRYYYLLNYFSIIGCLKYPIFYIVGYLKYPKYQYFSPLKIEHRTQSQVSQLALFLSVPQALHGNHALCISMKKCSANPAHEANLLHCSLLSPFCALWQVLWLWGSFPGSCKWTIIAFASFLACECWQCLSGTCSTNSLGQRWACESPGPSWSVNQPAVVIGPRTSDRNLEVQSESSSGKK